MILIPTYPKITPIGPIQQCAVTSPSTWRSPPSFYTVSPMLSACRDAVVMAPSSFRQCDRHLIHALFEQIHQAPFSLRAIHPLVPIDEFVDGGGRCRWFIAFPRHTNTVKLVVCASKIWRGNQGTNDLGRCTVDEFVHRHQWMDRHGGRESLGYWDEEGVCKSAEPSRG